MTAAMAAGGDRGFPPVAGHHSQSPTWPTQLFTFIFFRVQPLRFHPVAFIEKDRNARVFGPYPNTPGAPPKSKKSATSRVYATSLTQQGKQASRGVSPRAIFTPYSQNHSSFQKQNTQHRHTTSKQTTKITSSRVPPSIFRVVCVCQVANGSKPNSAEWARQSLETMSHRCNLRRHHGRTGRRVRAWARSPNRRRKTGKKKMRVAGNSVRRERHKGCHFAGD